MNLEDLALSILDDKPLIAELPDSTDQALFDAATLSGLSSHTDLMVVLEELLLNAREHGKDSPRVYLAVQDGWIYYAVTDLGSGIHQTIPANPKLSDTRGKATTALLRLACEEGITGTGTLGRGVGLYLLAQYCSKQNAEGYLWSNGGVLRIIGSQFQESLSNEPITGTIVCLKNKVGP